ncbi:MAG: ROK family protein [Fimbriimonas sp.]
MGHFWGVDLGGTKIEAVVLVEGELTEVIRHRIDTEADEGYAHIVDRIGLLLEEVSTKTGLEIPAVVGMGTPGAISPGSGLMKNSNTTCLNGQPLLADVQARVGREFRMANDANCFALAEATLGAARGYETVFGVIMGTGVGGGLVVNGRVLNGAHGIAGEWGHNELEASGTPCYCGKIGCVETVLSGTGLQRYYLSVTGESRRLDDILARARLGEDAAAVATMNRLIEFFGEALSVVVDIFDPHAIVLGGGVCNTPELYTLGVESLARWVFNDTFEAKVLAPALGVSAGVYGAAMLAS